MAVIFHSWKVTGVDSKEEALGSNSSGIKTIKVNHKHTL